MPDNEIGLKSVFDNDDFHKGASDYNRDIDSASQATSEAGSSMSYVWEGMAAVGQVAFAAIGAGLASMSAELYLAYDAAADAEDALTKVDFIVSGTADRTGVATEQVLALADSMSKVVPIDDEVIAQAAAVGLTFDGVNKDNLQPLLSAAADLSELTGKDLPSQMKTLALAITDTDKAARLFKDANITLTDAEEKQLKQLQKTGDTAGTTKFILDQLAKKGVLGLAEAMGQTNKGQLTIMQTMLGNLQETLGGGFLDAVSKGFGKITDFASDPTTIQFFADLGTQIGEFASDVISKIPDLIDIFSSLSTWFTEHKAIIIGVLAALGVAMAIFAFTAASAAVSTIIALAPIIIAFIAIAAVVALLYTAWTENWGGIQESVGALWDVVQPIFQSLVDWLSKNIPVAVAYLSAFWTNTLLPALQAVFAWISNTLIPLWITIIQWLSVNVPIAIQYLSDFWTNTLFPAIMAVADWINSNLIPVLTTIVQWLSVNVPLAVQTLSAIWTDTLLPAIQAVVGWISANLVPLFSAVANLIGAVLTVALTALAGIWQNILLPAIVAVGNWLSTNLMPILTTVGTWISTNFTPLFSGLAGVIGGTLMPALQPLASFLSGALKSAFDGITSAIQTVIGFVNDLTNALSNVELPDALTPGSPTPFEIGLKGINEQLKILSSARLPAVSTEMSTMNTSRDVSSAGGFGSGNQAGTVNNTSSTIRALLLGSTFNLDSSNTFFDLLSEL